jgi:hypothetical protein
MCLLSPAKNFTFSNEEKDFDPREAYPFVDEAMREDDVNDPSLGSYQLSASQIATMLIMTIPA